MPPIIMKTPKAPPAVQSSPPVKDTGSEVNRSRFDLLKRNKKRRGLQQTELSDAPPKNQLLG